MSEDFEIINKVANSGLVNFDISDLVRKGNVWELISRIFCGKE